MNQGMGQCWFACMHNDRDDPDVISFLTITINMFDNLSKGFMVCVFGVARQFLMLMKFLSILGAST